ncbi:MAG: 50S ribosomal protein L10 [Phycisphaerales bacterium]|nr:50S ribosomal protein L10 [Phycisphaerales bacterium]
MSKTVKNMILRDYVAKFGEESDVAVISIRGISSNDTNKIRADLRKKDIRVTIVRNALMKRQFADGALDALAPVLAGPSALAYGGASVVEVARELVALVKTFPGIELKGAVLDGKLFEGEDGVTALSKYPTREEALSQTVAIILSPARKLVSSVLGPGKKVASLVKTIEDKLEKGEAIAKVG